jgi:transcriptional regulator with XRE-family HTH domain
MSHGFDGSRLRRLRERRGWSVSHLAGRADLDRRTVALAEAGRRVPRPSTLRALAGALGCKVRDFYPPSA